MNSAILALNIGSSSIKHALFAAETLEPIERGDITGIGHDACFALDDRVDAMARETPTVPPDVDTAEAAEWLIDGIGERHPDIRLTAVGHRVVHGGTRFDLPVRVDANVLKELEALAPLAPGHQPAALEAIRIVSGKLAGVPQIACFDTAFHRTQPRLSQWFALPRELSEAGVIRYGFHGLSYEYITSVLPRVAGMSANGRIIVAHLGHGASLCAIRELRSVATTMGFTPLDGLMMGTRCGSIDPGVLLYLLRERGMSAAQLEDLLGNRSGLLGVSGISDDMRMLESSGDPRAHEALEMFADRAAAATAALAAVLGGLETLVFTGGIGERSAEMRGRICERLHWLGVVLDDGANARNATRICRMESRVQVFVIRTDEEIVIARAARALVAAKSGG